MKRILIGIAILLALAAPPAVACTCVSYDAANEVEIKALLDRGNVAATVLVSDVLAAGFAKFTVTVIVTAAHKGAAIDDVMLIEQDFSGACSCEPRMLKGQRFLVFGNRQGNDLQLVAAAIEFPDAVPFVEAIELLVSGVDDE